MPANLVWGWAELWLKINRNGTKILLTEAELEV